MLLQACAQPIAAICGAALKQIGKAERLAEAGTTGQQRLTLRNVSPLFIRIFPAKILMRETVVAYYVAVVRPCREDARTKLANMPPATNPPA